MRCTLCGREITLTQLKAGEYRRVEIETAACEPPYNMPVHVSCGARILEMIFGDAVKKMEADDGKENEN